MSETANVDTPLSTPPRPQSSQVRRGPDSPTGPPRPVQGLVRKTAVAPIAKTPSPFLAPLPIKRKREPAPETGWIVVRRAMRHRAIFGRLLCMLIVTVSIWQGLKLRDWTWENTRFARFTGDVANGFQWGLYANHLGLQLSPGNPGIKSPSWKQMWAGYCAVYPREMTSPRAGAWARIDYPPLRLLAVTVWAHQELSTDPTIGDWQDERTRSILKFNTAMELASAAGAFVLVRMTARRKIDYDRSRIHLQPGESLVDDSRPPFISGPTFAGLIAFICVWFNAAVILEAHGWPQWDIWCIPFFIAAGIAAFSNRWILAGALVCTGSMLKGQCLLVAPVFVLWPLLQLRLKATFDCMVGFAAAAALITSPWIFNQSQSWLWVGGGLLAIQLERFTRGPKLWSPLRFASLTVGIALIAWPLGRYETSSLVFVCLLAPLIALPIHLLSRHAGRTIGPAVRAVPAFVLFATTAVAIFGGDFSWLKLGFLDPTDHYRGLMLGAPNIPAVLVMHWGWQLDDKIFAQIANDHWPVWLRTATAQWGLRYIYAACLVLCSIAVAVHDRRRDPRALVALIAPWVIFYAILPQMHERYLIWGAALAAMVAPFSVELFALHLLVMISAFAPVAHDMLGSHHNAGYPRLQHFFDTFYPDWGWISGIQALAYLTIALTYTRRARSIRIQTTSSSDLESRISLPLVSKQMG